MVRTVTRFGRRAQLVRERVTGQLPADGFTSPEMLRAISLEDQALAAYEVRMNGLVTRIGFAQHDEVWAGCSPDGVVQNGVVEVKCPSALRHVDYLRSGRLPPSYRPQVLHLLWVTQADWLDFASFDPRYPEAWQLFVVRCYRDRLDVAGYARQALRFLDEVDRDVAVARTTTNLAGVLCASRRVVS